VVDGQPATVRDLIRKRGADLKAQEQQAKQGEIRPDVLDPAAEETPF
jgi:hypothetical protein